MSIFFQHVGEQGGNKHFPLTIGTQESGLKRFHYEDVESGLSNCTDREREEIRKAMEGLTPDGCQIWGIPSGASFVIREMRVGDWLLLLESDRPGGQFYFGGQVICRPPRELFDLSNRLWGEAKFPFIVFLNGSLTNYLWEDFCTSFEFRSNWKLQGRTYRLLPERISASPFKSEPSVIDAILENRPKTNNMEDQELLLDQVETMYSVLEGKQTLRTHIVRERDDRLIKRFKARLKTLKCSICEFDFGEIYGEIGRNFIEVHHIDPIGHRKHESITSIDDLIAVCSNCHSMLHRQAPPFSPNEIAERMARSFETKS